MGSALNTGVSGLKSQQALLEVIGNNLANLNTTSYKTRRTLFSDLFYETTQAASGGTPGVVGGRNPIQIGSGSKVAQVDLIRTQGSLASTGSQLDMAIDGEGFFTVSSVSETLYTRAGSFKVDDTGVLVDPSTGNRVQRFGTVGESGATGGGFQVTGNNDIRIPFGATIPGQVTSTIDVSGNLPSDASGPINEVLRNQADWTVAGVTANAASLLNDLDAKAADYVPGDVVEINGTDADGTVISTTLNVDATSTLGDLVAAVDAAYPGATATLDGSGRVVLTADTPGEAFLSLTLTNAPGNVGTTAFASNAFLVETDGQRGAIVRGGVEIFDARGGGQTIGLQFEKQADNTWTLAGSLDPGQGTVVDGLVDNIAFNQDGSLQTAGGIGLGNNTLSFVFAGSTVQQDVIISFGTPGGFDGMTELAASASLGADQDGVGTGTLSTVQVAADGIINGIATNGSVFPLAQLAIATFRNIDGLESTGSNYFNSSLSSGTAELGGGLVGGRGAVRGGQLEQSNVDIAEQFTQLIVAQRGFSANARTITVADQILEEVTNLIR